MLVLLHLDGSGERPVTGDPVLAGGRTVGQVGTVVEHVDFGPIALALVKRGIPADTALLTGGEHQVAAEIDPDSLPPAEVTGAAGWPWSDCGRRHTMMFTFSAPGLPADRGGAR